MLQRSRIEDARILIVDDEPANIRLLERILGRAGFPNPASATDPRQALSLYQQIRPDLVLLDLHMPHLDGFAVLEQLRSDIEEATYLPILVLSADITQEARQKALSGGAKDFLTKPFDPTEVLIRIRNLLETRALHLETQEQNRLLEEQLRHAQRLEVIGRLTSSIAHDFNNMLTVIHGNASMALMDVGEAEPLREDIMQIRSAAERAAALTRHVLNFSRDKRVDLQVLDLNAEILELKQTLLRLVGEDIEVVTRPDPALGCVRADPGQLEQVIMNLAVNARDAMPQGGKLLIETRNTVFSEEQGEERPFVAPGHYARLTVSDTGHGMDPATQEQVFTPFFTTKAEGKGTGLGLSIVYSIMKQCRGYVWAESEVGAGTRFTILLPLATEPISAVRGEGAPGELPTGSGTVLVVEDEEVVRSFIRKVLLKAGYRVLEAKDAEEALQFCEQYHAPIHLVVADIVLPGLDGNTLAEQLRTLRPETRVLLISGYPEYEELAEEVRQVFLKKPFATDEFVHNVRELINAG